MTVLDKEEHPSNPNRKCSICRRKMVEVKEGVDIYWCLKCDFPPETFEVPEGIDND